MLLNTLNEGANSVLQTICSRAPAIHIPLASARMSIKLGEVPQALQCSSMHDAIVTYTRDKGQLYRYCQEEEKQSLVDADPTADEVSAPQPVELKPCRHKTHNDYISRVSRGIQNLCAGIMSVDARIVYEIELKVGPIAITTDTKSPDPFIAGMMYYKTCWCVGVMLSDDTPRVASLLTPLRAAKLWESCSGRLQAVVSDSKKLKHFFLIKHRIRWATLRKGIVIETRRVKYKPNLASLAPAPPAPPPSGSVPAPNDDDEAGSFDIPGEADALATMLEEVMGDEVDRSDESTADMFAGAPTKSATELRRGWFEVCLLAFDTCICAVKRSLS